MNWFRAFAPLLILMIPVFAMLFTDEVRWSLFDFVIMGLMLVALGVGVQLVARRVQGSTRLFLIVAVIILLFLLLWGEMAVGLFGSPISGD
jgi:hypothetical protein